MQVAEEKDTIFRGLGYYPFGAEKPGRAFASSQYKYGFNGMEKDDEVKGSGNSYTTEFRQYDPRIARWLSIDPKFKSFPWQSPYVAFDNDPINKTDPRGDAAGDPPYTITNGVMKGEDVTNSITNTTLRPKLEMINAIVLHRTVSSSASSAVTTTMNNEGKSGFHIVVDTDGSITQVNNFNNRANHVGQPKGDVSNYNSIGIEVVGMPVDKDGNSTTVDKDIVGWQDLTDEQIESTAQAVSTIMQEYDLGYNDVFPHEDVSYKTAGEGQTVLDAIQGRVWELMHDYMQKKTEAQDQKIHKDSFQELKSVNN